jgi:hypothetical protein
MINEFLGQTNFVGKDGFYWWVGQVETEKGEQKKSDDRYKVRIVGQHLKDCNAVSYEDLPWAIVMMPPTAPRREGGSDYASVKYQAGDWVIGFFLDGREGQQPVIMGSIGKQYKATTQNNKDKPAEKCLAFTSFVDPSINPKSAVPQQEESKISQGGLSGTSGGTNPAGASNAADLNGRVNASNETASQLLLGTKCCNAETNPAGEFFCVEVADAKCEDGAKDKSKFQTVLTELFGNISNNGGQLGTAIVGKYTGKLYDYIGIAQGHINKVMRLAKSLVARIKGEIFSLIKKGAKAVIDFLLTEEVVDTTAPGTFNGPYANSAEAVTPAKKRVGRLRGITKWINDQLKKCNCAIEDLDARLMAFIEQLIYGYLDKVFNAVGCFIDKIVNDILSQIQNFLDGVISQLLGPLQTILSLIANPLNIIGAALAQVFDLLGITCGGPGQECADKEQQTNCSGNCGKQEDGFGLDDLIAAVENGNLAPESACAASYDTNQKLPRTKVSVVGGRPNPTAFSGTTTRILPPSTGTPLTLSPSTFNSPTSPPPVSTPAPAPNRFTGSTVTPTGVRPNTQTTPSVSSNIPSPIFNLISNVNLDYTSDIGRGIKFSGSATNVTFSSVNTISNYNQPVSLIIRGNSSSIFDPVDTTVGDISYDLSVDKTLVFEGEFITFTLIANGGLVPDGTIFNYFIFGDITADDIVNQEIAGQMIMNGNVATKTISIAEDGEVEGAEVSTFNVLETGSTVPFTIIGTETEALPEGDTIPAFVPPVIGEPEVCPDGRVMDVPILEKGDAYIVPPVIIIEGAGYGASAIAELDSEGYLAKVKVQRSGIGYVPNRTRTRCVISDVLVANPGNGYYGTPTVFVNGRSNIAKAITENGIVTGIDITAKTQTFECTPRIEIVGGDGLGAKAFAIMECRDDTQFESFNQGIAPFGTDEVIDCP